MIDEIVEFFRRGRKADIVFFKIGGFWGMPWTVAPHDTDGAHLIIEHYLREHSDGLRHAECVRMRRRNGVERRAVVITDLPILRQTVMSLDDGNVINQLPRLIESPTLAALRSALAAVQAVRLIRDGP